MAQPIEPGVLRIFRWYVGIRLALLGLVALANRGDDPPDPLQVPATGILVFGLLFLVLMVPWFELRLGRLFLPLTIALATIAPIADAAANISGRLEAGMSPNDTLVDYWLPFFLLFVPFIITAWQYRYRWVVGFALASTVFEMVVVSSVFGEESVQLEVLAALLAARGFLFAFLGFFISKLVARQRDLRADLQRQAISREQLATGRERNRLARELHDTLAHSMTGTAIQLEAAQALWESDPDQARHHLDIALEGTRSGLSEARRAIEDLRASPLEEYGLAGALEWLVSDLASTSGADIEAHIIESIEVAPQIEQAVYRIAEEALANAVRHAAPARVELTLREEEGLTLTVADDGTGFDNTASRDGHHGLTGMSERAQLIGGSLEVSSRIGFGTQVTLTVPKA